MKVFTESYRPCQWIASKQSLNWFHKCLYKYTARVRSLIILYIIL